MHVTLTVNKAFGKVLNELESENYRKPRTLNITEDTQNYYPFFCMVDLWCLKSPALLDLLLVSSGVKMGHY